MITREFPEYGTKKYYENRATATRLTAELMAAGMKETFAQRDRYTLTELADIASMFANAVNEFEETMKRLDNFEGDEE